MLTQTLENKFRKLAEQGLGDEVVHHGGECFVVFRISETRAVYVRQFGARYDRVEVGTC